MALIKDISSENALISSLQFNFGSGNVLPALLTKKVACWVHKASEIL